MLESQNQFLARLSVSLPGELLTRLDVLEPGLYHLPVQTKVPPSVVLEAAEPAVVKVTIGQTVPALPPGTP